ncbi:MAG: thioredoxin family protein [Tannerella sp.]|jgi:thiol:disulfide interchange protein DsbD|nr:thioredoxin family protein [Tannerella sp.]
MTNALKRENSLHRQEKPLRCPLVWRKPGKSLWILALYSLFSISNAQIHEPVKWAFTLNDLPAAEKEILLTATIDEGWHLYDLNLPSGGPISTSISFGTVKGAELLGKPATSIQPTVVFDQMFDMELRWFSNKVSFIQKIKITDFRKFKLVGEVEFMTCNDETCLPPERIPFEFDSKNIKNIIQNASVVISPSKDSSLNESVSETDSLMPINDDSAKRSVSDIKEFINNKANNNNLNENRKSETRNVSLWTPVINELKALGDTTTSTTDNSLLYIFIAGFLGGLFALLTPCVWPMIPMTVSFFLKRSKNRKKAIFDAVLYALSIIVIYLTMGLIITGLFGASALNDLSTNAVFNILFFLLLVIFAVSFFGAFEMVLPSSWTNKTDSRADATTGLLSIFFMAFTLALVSFSCTGPIIGTLLVEAASQRSAVAPAIGMFGFALALALPFALFAVFPNMLQSMPKSGGWLNSVKVVLGFLELALALKFLSVADLAYGWRILDREVFIVLWIVIFALLGFYLLGMIRFKHDSELKYVSVPRLFLSIVSLAFAIYMIPGLWGAPLKTISAFTPPLYTQDFSLYENDVHAQFDDYETGMQHAARTGKPVIIDFTGFGCVNCRKMEAAVWTDARVKHVLENDYVLVSLFVDDKTKLTQPVEFEENGKKRTLKTIGDKWSYLQRNKFGANAQPFYVILDNKGFPLAPSYAYDEDVQKYINFLENGKKQFKAKETRKSADAYI